MYKGILILFTLLLSFSACSIKEDERGGPVVTDEKIRFELFTKTGAYGLPVARASAKQPWSKEFGFLFFGEQMGMRNL